MTSGCIITVCIIPWLIFIDGISTRCFEIVMFLDSWFVQYGHAVSSMMKPWSFHGDIQLVITILHPTTFLRYCIAPYLTQTVFMFVGVICCITIWNSLKLYIFWLLPLEMAWIEGQIQYHIQFFYGDQLCILVLEAFLCIVIIRD